MTFKLPAFTILDNEGPSIPLFTPDQVLAAYEQGKAENAKDAERYRWLRHGDNDEHVLLTHDGKLGVRPFDSRFDGVWLPRNEKLDAAIDAALKESASRAIQAPKEGEA